MLKLIFKCSVCGKVLGFYVGVPFKIISKGRLYSKIKVVCMNCADQILKEASK